MNGRSQCRWVLKQKKILHLPERGGALAIDEALRRCDAAEKYLFGRLGKIQERSFRNNLGWNDIGWRLLEQEIGAVTSCSGPCRRR
jgi:hypothetical protein